MIIMHDYMEHSDGGSRLCLELARSLPAELLCGFVRLGHPFCQGSLPVLHTLIPPINMQIMRQCLLALAFSHGAGARRALSGRRRAIFSGSYAPLAVRQCGPQSRTILYCHTPPRFLYDQREVFSTMVPLPLRPVLHAFCAYLRPRYEAAVARMDAIAVNSVAVRGRVQRYLGRSARVIYPPCRLESYTWSPPQKFYLSMVRLDALKRVDICIRAFLRMPALHLVVLSDGPEALRLRRLAGNAPNIRFMGTVSEKERLRLLSQCIATICTAKEEDFGMCAVESLAAGKPVLATRSGGLAEICASTDYCLPLPPDPTVDDLCAVLQKCTATAATSMRAACRARAEDFSLARFVREMREILE